MITFPPRYLYSFNVFIFLLHLWTILSFITFDWIHFSNPSGALFNINNRLDYSKVGTNQYVHKCTLRLWETVKKLLSVGPVALLTANRMWSIGNNLFPPQVIRASRKYSVVMVIICWLFCHGI